MFNQDVSSKGFGLFFCCVATPAMYGLLMLFVVLTGRLPDWTGGQKAGAVFLIMLPVHVAGWVQRWDVWVRPAPKLGSDWLPVPPEDFVSKEAKVQGFVAAGIIVTHLLVQQFEGPEQLVLWPLFLAMAWTALYVPHRVQHDSGKEILGTGAGAEEPTDGEVSAKEPDGLGAVVREIIATLSGAKQGLRIH